MDLLILNHLFFYLTFSKISVFLIFDFDFDFTGSKFRININTNLAIPMTLQPHFEAAGHRICNFFGRSSAEWRPIILPMKFSYIIQNGVRKMCQIDGFINCLIFACVSRPLWLKRLELFLFGAVEHWNLRGFSSLLDISYQLFATLIRRRI